MDTAEIIRRVRRVEIRTSRLATAVMAGSYRSVFKGRGMDFEELREYVPGDDVRALDPNASARAGKPFVKVHREERDLTLILAVDLSASFDFGSGGRTKREYAAELAATLAFSAAANNDKTGLYLFTDDTELFVPPRKGRRHTLRLIRDMLLHAPKRKGTNLPRALARLDRMLRARAVIFLVTDFLHTPRDDATMRALGVTNARHDLICLHVSDPRETVLPAAGLLTMEDSETGELVEIDTVRESVRENYAKLCDEREEALRVAMVKSGVGFVGFRTDEDHAARLRRFLDSRKRRA